MSSSRLKSSVKGSANGIGIEFTSTSFTALSLRRESGFLSIAGVGGAPLSNEEGDDEELSHAVRKLAKSESRVGNNLCISLQPLASTELIHIVPTALPKEAVKSIVHGHVSQIESSADVEFIYDYQEMDSCLPERKNVIISMARANIVDECCDSLRQHPFRSHKVTSHNLALASAFFALHTKIAESAEPQVLLFLEEESTALTIVFNGGVQYSTWLSFGRRNLTVSLNRNERNGRQVLKEEFENAVLRWRETLQNSMDDRYDSKSNDDSMAVDNVWYSGPIDAMEPFAEMLSSIMPDVRLGAFGVPGNMLPNPDETVHTELTIAFGLALQSIGESPITISLLPQRLKWIEHKEKEYIYLSISSILLIFGLLVLMLGMLLHLNRSISALNRESDELTACSKMIPQLDKYHDKMSFQQRKIIPVAEALHRTNCFMEALTLWQKAEKAGDAEEQSWGIYLADEVSFERSNSPRESSEVPRLQTPARQTNAPMDLFATETSKQPAPAATSRVHTISVDELRILKCMYIGGIVPLGKLRYKTVKDIQTRLVESGVYVNVDDHSDSLSQRFTDNFYAPWLKFLKDNSGALQSEYTTFLMQLPFREEFITTERPQATSKKSGK